MKKQTVTFYHSMQNQNVHCAYLIVNGQEHLTADIRSNPANPNELTLVTSNTTLLTPSECDPNNNRSWKRNMDEDNAEGFLSKTVLECDLVSSDSEILHYTIVRHDTIGEHLTFGY